MKGTGSPNMWLFRETKHDLFSLIIIVLSVSDNQYIWGSLITWTSDCLIRLGEHLRLNVGSFYDVSMLYWRLYSLNVGSFHDVTMTY